VFILFVFLSPAMGKYVPCYPSLFIIYRSMICNLAAGVFIWLYSYGQMYKSVFVRNTCISDEDTIETGQLHILYCEDIIINHKQWSKEVKKSKGRGGGGGKVVKCKEVREWKSRGAKTPCIVNILNSYCSFMSRVSRGGGCEDIHSHSYLLYWLYLFSYG